MDAQRRSQLQRTRIGRAERQRCPDLGLDLRQACHSQEARMDCTPDHISRNIHDHIPIGGLQHEQFNDQPLGQGNEQPNILQPDQENVFDDINGIDAPPDDDFQNDEGDINIQDFVRSFCNGVLGYISKLYSIPHANRAMVQLILESTSELFSGYTKQLSCKVERLLANVEGHDIDKETILQMFSVITNPFKRLETEHQRFLVLSDSNLLFTPQRYVIGEYNNEMVRRDNELIPAQVTVYGHVVPLRHTLKKFLELPGVLQQILENMNTLNQEHNIVSNVIQGSVWRERAQDFGERIVLPLNISYDDFVPDHVLLAHASEHELGPVYCTIPVVPQQHLGALENKFVVALMRTKHRIHEECTWNAVPNFHCCSGVCGELAHDLCEGDFWFCISRILWCLIYEQGYFTLQTLIDRSKGFTYGPLESGNKPPVSILTQEKLRGEGTPFAAAEMLCFVRNLGEIIGDLVPANDVYWNFYPSHRVLIDILFKPSFARGTENYVDDVYQYMRLEGSHNDGVSVPVVHHLLGGWLVPHVRRRHSLQALLHVAVSQMNF
ncbi:hypothetical protein FOCC_FOCC006592 [Frankliniella occidentalis]|nr:hypothetical protein FOCC_FOCC006592 [Frankliniella occidentalis]